MECLGLRGVKKMVKDLVEDPKFYKDIQTFLEDLREYPRIKEDGQFTRNTVDNMLSLITDIRFELKERSYQSDDEELVLESILYNNIDD